MAAIGLCGDPVASQAGLACWRAGFAEVDEMGLAHATASAGGAVLGHITDAHVAPSGRRNAALKHKSLEIFQDLVGQLSSRGVDTVLFGGDNIDNRNDGARDLAAFCDIAGRLQRYQCIVGNHESVIGSVEQVSKETFAAKMSGHGIGEDRLCFSAAVQNVRVIGIDTTLMGSSAGYVSPRTMRFMAEEFHQASEEHIVVVGHHLLHRAWEPHRLESWDADYLVSNREAVTALLASCPKVRAYLCGHHHASRIQRVASRGQSGGFYHILTASPVSFPHAARVLRFEHEGIHVEMIRPKIDGLIKEGREAVLSGRKARRFETLGSRRSFLEYVAGRSSDNDVVLPYDHAPPSIARCMGPKFGVERRGPLIVL